MSFSSLSLNRITGGSVSDKWWKPRIHSPRRPVIFMTGGSGTAASGGAGDAAHIVDAVVAAGYTIVMPSVPSLLGNPTSVTRVASAVAYARSALGCTADSPVIIGQSNGGICGLNYARQHATAAIIGLVCPVDLDAIYQDDLLGLRSTVGTAWGVTYPTPLPAGASPSANTAELSGLSIQMWEASNDPLAVGMSSFVTATAADLHDVGPLGHTSAAVQAISAEAVVEFVLNL